MRKLVLAAVLCLATPAFAQPAPPVVPLAPPDTARLTVTGYGSVAAVPDLARITLGVTETARTAAAAMTRVSEVSTGILQAIEAAGIDARDVQTSDLGLSPLWSTSRSTDNENTAKITGFQATNTITVRVRDLDRLGPVLDSVLAAGANTFRGLSFGLQDPEPAADEARRLAVADALRKARLFAEAAGMTLGGILAMDEGAGARPQAMEMTLARGGGPIAAGEVSTEASVSVVFALGAGG